MDDVLDTNKPIIVTFRQLTLATHALHMGERVYIDRLHDVWLRGAPTPDSIVRNPKGYDPRKAQPGNVEKRILRPMALAEWIRDTSAARGMPLTWRQCLNIANGEADYGLDMHDRPLIFNMKG